jgi:hypothetical protein
MKFRTFSAAIFVAFMLLDNLDILILQPRYSVSQNDTIDVLTATASDLRKLLDSREFSSVELVGLYLDQTYWGCIHSCRFVKAKNKK